MDIGRLAEAIATDCEISLDLMEKLGDFPELQRHIDYLAYFKGEKTPEEMVHTVSQATQDAHGLLRGIFGHSELIPLPSQSEVQAALEIVRPKLEELFKQYGVL